MLTRYCECGAGWASGRTLVGPGQAAPRDEPRDASNYISVIVISRVQEIDRTDQFLGSLLHGDACLRSSKRIAVKSASAGRADSNLVLLQPFATSMNSPPFSPPRPRPRDYAYRANIEGSLAGVRSFTACSWAATNSSLADSSSDDLRHCGVTNWANDRNNIIT